MASAEQLKALLTSYMDGDDTHFFSVAMQIAAHEAKLGHGKLAQELRSLIDQAKRQTPNKQFISVSQPSNELSSLLAV